MIIQTSTTPVGDEDGEDRGEAPSSRPGSRCSVCRLGSASASDAGEQAEDHDREELGGRHDAEPERVVGQLEDEPGLGDLLHPGPDQRDRLAAEEQPVVAVAEGAQPSATGDAARSSAGARSSASAVGGRSGCVGPAVELARCASRCGARLGLRRSSAPSRAAFASSVSIWRSTRARRVDQERPALGRVARSSRKRSRLRSRAASSSSSWPIWASENPASSRRLADEPQALEVRRVVQAVGAVRAGGRLEQPDLLVVADRAGRQAGLGGDLLDAQEPGSSDARGGVVVTPRLYVND